MAKQTPPAEMTPEELTAANEKVAAEANAVAWLAMSDDDLIRNSASLGLDGDLHPVLTETIYEGQVTGREHTASELKKAREAADEHARVHVSAAFVKDWIKENRAA